MLDLTPIDIVGITGAILVVGAYFLNQVGRLQSESLTFPVVNMIGAGLIVWSLLYDFNAGALSLIHISEPTSLGMISYAVFCSVPVVGDIMPAA